MNLKRTITFITGFIILIASYFQVAIINGNKDNQLVNNVEETPSGLVNIYIGGEVNIPNWYEVNDNYTISDLVYRYAGGFTNDADLNCINVNNLVKDMIYLIIPRYGNSTCNMLESNEISEGLININTASVELLTSLTNIGQSRANNIVQYRNNNGLFTSIEEIMNVDGIGTGIFNDIKDYITV